MSLLSPLDRLMKEFNVIQATILLMLAAMTDDNHQGKSFDQASFRGPYATASSFASSLVLGLKREHATTCRSAERDTP